MDIDLHLSVIGRGTGAATTMSLTCAEQNAVRLMTFGVGVQAALVLIACLLGRILGAVAIGRHVAGPPEQEIAC